MHRANTARSNGSRACSTSPLCISFGVPAFHSLGNSCVKALCGMRSIQRPALIASVIRSCGSIFFLRFSFAFGISITKRSNGPVCESGATFNEHQRNTPSPNAASPANLPGSHVARLLLITLLSAMVLVSFLLYPRAHTERVRRESKPGACPCSNSGTRTVSQSPARSGGTRLRRRP